jgi:hypothetical protein
LVENIGKYFILGSVLSSIVMPQFSLHPVWSLLNAVQMSGHLTLLSFPLSGNTANILNQILHIGRCDYFGQISDRSHMYSDTEAWSNSFESAGYTSTSFLRLFGSIWIYFLILGLHGLIVIVFNVTKLRENVRSSLDENLVGWLLKITQTSFWFDAVILLMAQSFFELLLCFVVGFESLK